jgi:hypothetical protein
MAAYPNSDQRALVIIPDLLNLRSVVLRWAGCFAHKGQSMSDNPTAESMAGSRVGRL